MQFNKYTHTYTTHAFATHQAYDEVVLTTDWEADGFLSACVVFAVFTAEARRAHAADGHER